MAARLVAKVLRPGALLDPDNFRLWERRGFHVTPVHFHSPIPSASDLAGRTDRTSGCPGIDFRTDDQVRLLKESFARFAPETDAFPIHPTRAGEFHLENGAFGGIDPHVYHCMIRHFRPGTVVEIGSGHTTVLGAQACRLSGAARYVCIDPWPRDGISGGLPGVEVVRRKVEEVDPEIFLRLRENDILFIDSSHVVRTAGDVCFLFLEVLPRLAPGVIVHVHDIFLPFDYPAGWILDQQRFWTEQYLLQAYLAENRRCEVLFACHYLCRTRGSEVRAAFTKATAFDGGSFWFRKV